MIHRNEREECKGMESGRVIGKTKNAREGREWDCKGKTKNARRAEDLRRGVKGCTPRNIEGAATYLYLQMPTIPS